MSVSPDWGRSRRSADQTVISRFRVAGAIVVYQPQPPAAAFPHCQELLAALGSVTAQRDMLLSERNRALAEMNSALAERNRALAEARQACMERDYSRTEAYWACRERDAVIAERDRLIRMRRHQMSAPQSVPKSIRV